MAQDVRAVRTRISGKVQGVGFRFWTRREAERLALAGWVRNEKDGSVAAVFSGPETAVALMLDLLWEGPPGAQVSGVETHEDEPGERAPGFRIVD